MTQDEKKKTPSAAPGAPALGDKLALALKDQQARRPFQVTLKIRGGIRGQHYSLDFLATGEGTAHARFECGLRGRRGNSERASISDKDFLSLLRKVHKALLLPLQQPQFLPDTLVGVLEVSDGEKVRQLYYAADPEQAKTQGKPPPAELLEAVNAIYSLGAKLTGSRSIKP